MGETPVSVDQLSCLTCQQPAIIVLSARIDAGTASYPACPLHVPMLGHRLIEDAGRAVANLLTERTTRRRDAIDVDTVEVEVLGP